MRRTAIVLLVWAGLLAVNTSVMFIFNANAVSFALLGGASLATAVVATGLLLGPTRDIDPDAHRPVTDLSVASGWTGLGVALLLLAGRFGVYDALLAGGMIIFGVAGIIRELRIERRVRRSIGREAGR